MGEKLEEETGSDCWQDRRSLSGQLVRQLVSSLLARRYSSSHLGPEEEELKFGLACLLISTLLRRQPQAGPTCVYVECLLRRKQLISALSGASGRTNSSLVTLLASFRPANLISYL